MRAWAVSVIVAAVAGGVLSLLLPNGEKSPLYRPIRFLSALILLLLLCSPFLRLLRDPTLLSGSDFAAADEGLTYDPGAILLEQSEKTVEKRVREAFPEGDYRIVFDTDEEERTVRAIRVETKDADLGRRIADWLRDQGLAST